ncbi:unnamed protein product [Penicillium roqueforti FM164]|uniref:Uncharacterized protein n=1 Tax=Penicillium roqueforti (strain FM164) TaxID=1365484 RepID=W6R9L9_PENRF|nr:unnamed protein product [Penicillium roqueforti FM164]
MLYPVAGKLLLWVNPSGSVSTDKKRGLLSQHSERNNSTSNCRSNPTFPVGENKGVDPLVAVF